MRDDLTPKELLFVLEYIIDFNGQRAAVAAGYSEKTARVQASQMLNKERIQESVKQAMEERIERTKTKGDQVVEELSLVAFSDIANYLHVDREGVIHLKTFDELKPEHTRVVKKIKQKVLSTKRDKDKTEEVLQTEIELWDKIKSNELLGRHLGLWDKGEGSDEDPPRIVKIIGVDEDAV